VASRYDLFRRIVAPLALVAALGLLAHQTCGAEERAAVGFAVDLGDAAATVERVRVELWSEGAMVGSFEADADRPLRWRQPVPRDELEARIELTRADGTVESVRRRVHAPSGAEVTIRP
jgi:hypothetical protein